MAAHRSRRSQCGRALSGVLLCTRIVWNRRLQAQFSMSPCCSPGLHRHRNDVGATHHIARAAWPTGLRGGGEACVELEKTLKRYVIWTKRQGLKIQRNQKVRRCGGRRN
jgi:hypothetical protein